MKTASIKTATFIVSVQTATETIYAKVGLVRVGRVNLYLLNTTSSKTPKKTALLPTGSTAATIANAFAKSSSAASAACARSMRWVSDRASST